MAQARSFSLSGSNRSALLLAAILAAVTGVLVFIILQTNDGGGDAVGGNEALTTVVTAAEDIPAGTKITADMLTLTKLPGDVIVNGAFTDRNSAIDTVARYPIYKGEQLGTAKIAAASEGGLSARIKVGERAVAVGVDQIIGVAGLIRPADHVDVMVLVDVEHQNIETGESVTQTVVLTIAQNIEVLAVEDKLLNVVGERDQQPESDGTTTNQAAPVRDGNVLTLALSPLAAQNLLLADGKGELRLTLRARGDDTIVDGLGSSTYIDLADPEFAQLLRDAIDN
jgi:pilus assembly protein CpaB